jgi:predicted small lipoprotein YifL
MLQNLKLKSVILSIILIFLTSCGGGSYFPDAKKQPVNADDRIKKNLSEGRGLKLINIA